MGRKSLEKTAALWSEGQKRRGWKPGGGRETRPELICPRWDAGPGEREAAAVAAAVS